MLIDDRLETVLRNRGSSEAALRTQFRQLLDILGAQKVRAARRGGHDRDPTLVAAAWLRMDMLGEAIPEADRAAMIREPGWRFRNPELAAHFAQGEPDVASAALARVQLSPEDWAALIPRLPVRARGFLRLRRDLPSEVEEILERLGIHDRGLPQPEEQADRSGEAARPTGDDDAALTGQSTDPSPDPASEGRSEISALVERIARFKRSREAARETDRELDRDVDDRESMPRLPLGEEFDDESRKIRVFGFAADAAGRIEWAERPVAAMVIGARLVRLSREAAGKQADPIERALIRRQPIEDAPLKLDGAEAVAGDWLVNARPRFTEDGNFAGYVGRFRRPVDAKDAATEAAKREADRIRQLLHELRTPVTAVQGYAEVIQQQLFGTAPHEYRALAAAIAADAAWILAGFEELDRLARLESGALELASGRSDLAEASHATIMQLSQVLASRMAGIELAGAGDERCAIGVGREQLDGLLWRLLATLGGGCGAGEVLTASLVHGDDDARLRCDLPAQLLEQDDIFSADVRPVDDAVNAGLFGAGFALRLARAEARGAGGDLVREGDALVLTLPLFDEAMQTDRATSG